MSHISLIERHLAAPVRVAMQDTPAVLINGPRQSGKTTLAQQLAQAAAHTPGQPPLPYLTLDNPSTLAAAQADPTGFVRALDGAVIDEIQRAPQLMLALKQAIDTDRRPGRFLLTGSANILALPQMADSLAGRMEVHALLPLSQAEVQGRPPTFLDHALAHSWPTQHPITDVQAQALAGGYPEMRSRATLARRQAWARSYLTSLLERDVQDIARIDQLMQMPQLLNLLATQCGQLLNLTQLAAPLGLDAKTASRYVGILERLYLVQRLPAWGHHEANRIVKTPKLHFLDAGLQAAIARLSPELLKADRSRWGATLETWVYAELRKTLALRPEPWYLSHYRDKDQMEVDFVLENAQRQLIGVEVKAAATVQAADFKGLKRLQDLGGSAFITGIVVYDGTDTLPFGDRLWAVPLSAL